MKTVKRTGLQRKLMATAVTAWLAGPLAYGNPVGPVVVSGQAYINAEIVPVRAPIECILALPKE